MTRVLIVDDQFLIVEYLKLWVESFGHTVCGTADTADTAVTAALALKPDYILMDVRLDGGRDGVDVAIEIVAQHPCRIVYVTGSNEQSTMTKIASDHPFRTLTKPVDLSELREALAAA